jgi:hypothetical protein
MEKKSKEKNKDVIKRPTAIPVISNCSMTDCAFNSSGLCHAASIDVGDDHQKCDTYIVSGQKIGESSTIGGVGTCKVSKCSFNKGSMCGAGAITVSRHNDHADCGMFKLA